MPVDYVDATTPLKYHLKVGTHDLVMNDFLGKKITLKFTGDIFCIHCGKKTKKSFAQGYCYPCFTKLAQTDMCIVKPHECHHHLGTCRDDDFAQSHCFIPHVVYLAVSSGAKVGITREHQKITRWADQGAIAAIEVGLVPNRKIAGEMEVDIAQNIADKTNWRKMLASDIEVPDLAMLKESITAKLAAPFKNYVVPGFVTRLTFPVLSFPPKINSYNPEKDPVIEDVLTGIKGQYLVFEKKVINIRTYQGYEFTIA